MNKYVVSLVLFMLAIIAIQIWFNKLQNKLIKLNEEINSSIKELSEEPGEYEYNQRIVCAANLYPDGTIILGARHHDSLMNDCIKTYIRDEEYWNGPNINFEPGKAIQGFIDQRCNFFTREEAWVIAEKANQIAFRCGGDTINGGRLFSENLY